MSIYRWTDGRERWAEAFVSPLQIIHVTAWLLSCCCGVCRLNETGNPRCGLIHHVGRRHDGVNVILDWSLLLSGSIDGATGCLRGEGGAGEERGDTGMVAWVSCKEDKVDFMECREVQIESSATRFLLEEGGQVQGGASN